MAEYNNNNVIEGASSNIEIKNIALFPNGNKTKDNQPDYYGTIVINGAEHQIAFWSKTSKNGKNYLSGQISPKVKPASSVESSEPDDSPF